MHLTISKKLKGIPAWRKWGAALVTVIMAMTLVALWITQGDLAEGALGATETTESNLGTITIPSAGVRAIVGIYGIATIQTTTLAEGTSGHFRLSFKSVPGTFRFPATIFQGAAGTLADIGGDHKWQIIPVNIPVPPNETVTAYMTLNLAQTGTCRGMVGLIME